MFARSGRVWAGLAASLWALSVWGSEIKTQPAFDPLLGEPQIAPELQADAGSELFIVQLLDTPDADDVADIAGLGGVVFHYVPSNAFVVRMGEQTRAEVENLPSVRWVGAYHPYYRLAPELRDLSGTEAERYGVSVFESDVAHKARVAQRIEGIGGSVIVNDKAGFVMQAMLTPTQVMAVVHLDEVAFVSRWGEAVLFADKAAEVSGAVYVAGVTGYHGANVIGEVLDAFDIDADHLDWNGTRDPVAHRSSSVQDIGIHATRVFGCIYSNNAIMPAATGVYSDFLRLTEFDGDVPRRCLTCELRIEGAGERELTLAGGVVGWGLTWRRRWRCLVRSRLAGSCCFAALWC